MLQFIFPRLAQKLGITFLDKDATEFFMRIVRQTMKHRRETGVRRNDIVDILMDELDKDHDETLFTKEELEIGFVGTSVLFFFAGFDTTSTTLSLVVHALVHHPEVQELVRKEIEDVIGDDEEITADHLKELKFMENVIHESMRKYFGFGEYTAFKYDEPIIIFSTFQLFKEPARKTTNYQEQTLLFPRV